MYNIKIDYLTKALDIDTNDTKLDHRFKPSSVLQIWFTKNHYLDWYFRIQRMHQKFLSNLKVKYILKIPSIQSNDIQKQHQVLLRINVVTVKVHPLIVCVLYLLFSFHFHTFSSDINHDLIQNNLPDLVYDSRYFQVWTEQECRWAASFWMVRDQLPIFYDS